jgi:sec-independent protein translocase protein TatA
MLGTPELLVILAVIVVIFGPGKVSDIGKALGKSIHDFNRVKETGEKILKDPLEAVQKISKAAEPSSESKQEAVKPPTPRSETS